MKAVEVEILVRPTTTLAGAATYAQDIAFTLGAEPDPSWREGYVRGSRAEIARFREELQSTFSQADLARYAGDLANILTRFSAIAARSGWTGPIAELFPVSDTKLPEAWP
jgi:hypothetical protein